MFTSAEELKRKSLKREVKKAAEKVEQNCEEFQKIVAKRRKDKLDRLHKNVNSLKDGGEEFIRICRSFKTKISEEIGDGLMQDVIVWFLNDIESGNLSEQEALKNLCNTANDKMKHAIVNVTTNANKEFERWDKSMENVSNLSESKFSAIECQASQFNIREELPGDKYNPWWDPWSSFTGIFRPISKRKVNGWKIYLEEELNKLREDSKKLIDNELEEIKKLKRSELYNAESKFQREKDWLNDKKHPLNKWSNELGSARDEAKSIREKNDKKLWEKCEDPFFFLLIRETASFLYFTGAFFR